MIRLIGDFHILGTEWGGFVWGWDDSPAKIRRFLIGFHRQWRFAGTLEQHRGISTTKMRDMMGYIIMGYITKLGDLPPTHGHMMSYSSGR